MTAPFPKILFGAVALFALLYTYALVISPQADTGLKYASQVGKALLLYQADYDARLPVASTWMDDMDRYTSKTILMGNPQSIPGTLADAPWVGMNRLASAQPHYAFEESAVLAFSSAQPRWNSNGGPEALGTLKREVRLDHSHGLRCSLGRCGREYGLESDHEEAHCRLFWHRIGAA